MLDPLMESVSRFWGSLFLMVILTCLRCVFMATSTPVTVPWTWVPFFNSIVTVSWLNFIKKRTSFMVSFTWLVGRVPREKELLKRRARTRGGEKKNRSEWINKRRTRGIQELRIKSIADNISTFHYHREQFHNIIQKQVLGKYSITEITNFTQKRKMEGL